MRNIFFRAYCSNAKMMLQDVVVHNGGDIGTPHDEEINAALVAKGFKPDDYDFPEEWADTGEDWFFISKTKVMQSTGVTSGNGIMVYEGDIVSRKKKGDNFPVNWVVKWNQQYVGFMLTRSSEFDSNNHRTVWNDNFNITYSDGDIYQDETIDVIGNIFENPELNPYSDA